jgi:hypothetical protein
MANTVDRVCFGVREQIEGGPLDFVVLIFDFKSFLFSRCTDGVERSFVPFAEFQMAQTNGSTLVVIQYHSAPAYVCHSCVSIQGICHKPLR